VSKEKTEFASLERKLDLILKLLAIDKLSEKTLIEQVELLDRFGFEAPEIALILNTSADNVRAQKSRVRRRREAGNK
jgi:DNA-directed RNA polymerase specialized sigma24 family protein